MFKQLLKRVLGFPNSQNSGASVGQPKEKRPLSNDYAKNLQALKEVFNSCSDIKFREFKISSNEPISACIVFVDSLIDPRPVSQQVIHNLIIEIRELPSSLLQDKNLTPEVLMNHVISLTETVTTTDLLKFVNYVLQGYIGLFIDGFSRAIVLAGVQGKEGRQIQEPDSEPLVKGPKDGFVESQRINVGLLRQRIKTSRFKIETLELGILTKTSVAVCYIEGIANPKVVQEVKTRLGRINIDGILAAGYIEELIQDQAISLFPLIQTTERPDKTAANLLEGKIAIICDTTPVVLIVPCTFTALLQATEDYYNTSPYSTFVRLIRFIALNIALMLPALTVAVLTFHQELLPTPLLSKIAASREGLPFPVIFEVLLMEVTFEFLREAGVRLPKTIGQAVSVVGGLVIGQAAVNSGIVGPIPVIVVALTAVASFTSPNYSAGTSIRILRFFLIFCAGILGFLGIMLALMLILFHLCSLRSFGTPYLTPVAPLSPGGLKDTFVRVPWWAMILRPRLPDSIEPARMDSDQGPTLPDEGGDVL